jgi:4-hydroxybenzoate polyprenyltransferase
LGDKAAQGVAIFYAIAVLLWGAAVWAVRPDWLALLALLPAAIHFANQALRADPKDGDGALRLFRSNRTAGFLVFLGLLVVGLSTR